MLSPFVDKERLIEIFGHDLLDDETLSETFYGLINPDATKPFECVGTREEINYAIQLTIANSEEPLPKLLEWYRSNNQYQVNRNITEYFNPEHNIPEPYLKALLAL